MSSDRCTETIDFSQVL